ncbi:uncharacterized protein LOC100181082 [Ciona intestinalis]
MLQVKVVLLAAIVLCIVAKNINATMTSQGLNMSHYVPEDVPEMIRLVPSILLISAQGNSKSGVMTVTREEANNVVEIPRNNSIRKFHNNNWSAFSCCRRSTGTMGRTRIYSYYLIVDTQTCYSNYCPDTCTDDFSSCQSFRYNFNACNSPSYYGFMTLHCPMTCQRCRPIVTTTTTTTTTTVPLTSLAQPSLVRVNIYFTDTVYPYYYTYTTSQSPPSYPWKQVSFSNLPGEVSSFYLHSHPTPPFNVPIYFCFQNIAANYLSNIRVMKITNQPCSGGWFFDFLLYGSLIQTPNSFFLLVSTRDYQPIGSRVHRTASCCGYQRDVQYFYGLTNSAVPATVPATVYTVFPQPITTTTTQTPFVTQTYPPTVMSSALTSEQQACLDHHNFYRSLHNASPLQWDNDLFVTAQKWARYLIRVAAENPLRPTTGQTTSNWPHSDKGTEYRQVGVGENIAWDMSTNGSPIQESILRWYLELFDYDRTNPISRDRNRPTGHFSQMLWRATTKVACATATRTVYRHGTSYIASYNIAHYYPLGNIYYPGSSRPYAAFESNVRPLISGACRSPDHCARDSGCVGFSATSSCVCSGGYFGGLGGNPQCSGQGGCAVSCAPPTDGRSLPYNWVSECRGERLCRCSYQVVNNRLGAICDQ